MSALYVGPCLSAQLYHVHLHAFSAVVYFCATPFLYKSSQNSPGCTKRWRLMEGEHVHVVVLNIFQMNKVDLTRTQCASVPNSSFSSSEKV